MNRPPSPSPAPAASWAEAAVTTTIVLIGITIVATLSLTFDARMASEFAHVTPDALAWGRFMSSLGLSGYMFAISGVVMLGAVGLRRSARRPASDATLALMAERAAYVFATLCVSGLAAQAIKHLVGRARPTGYALYGAYHFDLLSIKNSFASFPSGHATTVFAMAVALSLLAPPLRVPLFILAAAIAFSRVMVEAHYLSDIVCGALLGAVSARLTAGAFARRGIAFLDDGGRPALKGPHLLTAGVAR